MMADPGPMVADLRAESDDLDALVAPLAAARWADLCILTHGLSSRGDTPVLAT